MTIWGKRPVVQGWFNINKINANINISHGLLTHPHVAQLLWPMANSNSSMDTSNTTGPQWGPQFIYSFTESTFIGLYAMSQLPF